MNSRSIRGLFAVMGTAGAVAATTAGVPLAANAAAQPNDPPLTAHVLLDGASLHHAVKGKPESLTDPDDVVHLGSTLFVAFQNGVGSMGEPSPTGNTHSTLVEMTSRGEVLGQWDLAGKIDGLGADQANGTVVATVNEDGNSSLYTLETASRTDATDATDATAAGRVRILHYLYQPTPLPHGGGTDAVSFFHGRMLVSASAPSKQNGPAAYTVSLHAPTAPGMPGVASVHGLFLDDASATPGTPGAPHRLALTDPDSNTVVPASAARFAGDFMLDSQGDKQQIYVRDPASRSQHLTVLPLSQSVDDTAFAAAREGALYVTDASADTVVAITGHFEAGQVFTSATPCNANNAPTTCPAPGFPANYLGKIDLRTGHVSRVTTSDATLQPKGLIFIAQR